MDRRHFLLSSGAALIASSRTSLAATISLQQIEAEIATGKSILLHVTAPWCGACRLQKPIVAKLLATPEYSAITKVDVDFDSQKDVLRKFRVQTQATMLIFKGGTETNRLIGVTDASAIASFLKGIA